MIDKIFAPEKTKIFPSIFVAKYRIEVQKLLHYQLLAFALFCLCSCGRSNHLLDGNLPPSSRAKNHSDGIIHGKTADLNKAAARTTIALVTFANNNQSICSATILSNDSLLTAAHCVDHEPNKIIALFSRDIKTTSPEQKRKVDYFAQHPRWRSLQSQALQPEGRGDLAVLHFDGGLPDGYNSVHLAPGTLILQPGTETLLLGYGVNNGSSHLGSGVLRETSTRILKRISTTEMLVDGRESSVCFGDSGGPAFISNGSQLLQWGIASAVTNKTCTQASVHTEIKTYLAWIRTAATKLRARSSKSNASGRQSSYPTAVHSTIEQSDSNTDSYKQIE